MDNIENVTLNDVKDKAIKIRNYLDAFNVKLPMNLAESLSLSENPKSHYLLWWWTDLLSFLRDWESGKKIDPSMMHGGFNLLNLYRQIQGVSHINGFVDIESRLATKNEFLGAAFEISVLSFLTEKYPDAKPIKSGGRSTPDFEITRDEISVFIEAKCINYDVSECDNFALHISNICSSMATKNKNSCYIKIIPKVILANLNQQKVKNELKKHFRGFIGFPEESSSFEFEDFHLEISKLGVFEADKPIAELQQKISNIAKYRFATVLFSATESHYKNLIVVSVDEFKVSYLVAKLKGRIDDARKQLPASSSGIIYINLPYGERWNFEEIENSSLKELYRYVQGASKKINAVVLVGISSNSLSDNAPYISYERCVIPNFNCSESFPSWFSLIEKNIRLPEFSVKIGVEIKFGGVRIGDASEFMILNHCSSDGREQLKLYLDKDKNLRLKIVCKELGIVIVRFITMSLAFNQEYDVILQIKAQPVMFINGQKLEALVDDFVWVPVN